MEHQNTPRKQLSENMATMLFRQLSHTPAEDKNPVLIEKARIIADSCDAEHMDEQGAEQFMQMLLSGLRTVRGESEDFEQQLQLNAAHAQILALVAGKVAKARRKPRTSFDMNEVESEASRCLREIAEGRTPDLRELQDEVGQLLATGSERDILRLEEKLRNIWFEGRLQQTISSDQNTYDTVLHTYRSLWLHSAIAPPLRGPTGTVAYDVQQHRSTLQGLLSA